LGERKCHTFRGPHSTLDNVVSRVQHGIRYALPAGTAVMQALTSGLRARAPLQDWNQTNLHTRVINGVGHTSDREFNRPKRGLLTQNTPDVVVNYDADAPKVPHDGSSSGRPGHAGSPRPAAGPRPKRGTLTRDTPADVVIYDAEASKVPHDGPSQSGRRTSAGELVQGRGREPGLSRSRWQNPGNEKTPLFLMEQRGFSWWLRPASIR
jgi:hypothetical protein